MKLMFFWLTFLVSFSSWAQSGNVGTLFNSQSLPTPTQGKAGSVIASLSAGCQKLQNSGLTQLAQLVLPQYQIATSPVIPFVGFTMGLIQYDSPIMQTCNLVINIDKSDTQGIIMHTSNYANQLTANKFDTELNAVDRVMNLSNSMYDFNNGSFREGALTNAQTHQQMVGVLDASTKVYNRRIKDKNAGIETKAERRARIEQVVSASYRRAIIQDAINCPAPQSNKLYGKMWADFVPRRQTVIKDEQGNLDQYYDALTRMGSDMITDVGEVQEYVNLLNSLRFNSIEYRTTPTTLTQEDTELSTQKDKNGLPKKNTVKKTKRVNTFTAGVNQQILNNFRKKYVTRWQNYIKGQVLSSGTFGLLDDKKGRIEAKYRSYAFECSEKRLAQAVGLTPQDPMYQTRMIEEQTNCRDRLQVRDKEVESVFENYLTRLVSSLQIMSRNQTEIWNFEATTMGYNRELENVEVSGKAGNFQQMNVACSDKLEVSEMKKLNIENKKVNNELKEMWAKAKIENNMREEEKAKANFEALDESKKKARSAMRQAEGGTTKEATIIRVDPTEKPKGL